jgi:hypothetical protein
VTGFPLSFFNVMVSPAFPCHELLHTFLSAIVLLSLPYDFGAQFTGRKIPGPIPAISAS